MSSEQRLWLEASTKLSNEPGAGFKLISGLIEYKLTFAVVIVTFY